MTIGEKEEQDGADTGMRPGIAQGTQRVGASSLKSEGSIGQHEGAVKRKGESKPLRELRQKKGIARGRGEGKKLRLTNTA
eukprot:scaffold298432_cov22-Tisochrysis_lutea.AAC.1